MKMKKLLSGLLVAAMSLTFTNVSLAEEKTPLISSSFDTAVTVSSLNWTAGTAKHTTAYNHTNNEGGSVMLTATSTSVGGRRQGAPSAINRKSLYKLSVWVMADENNTNTGSGKVTQSISKLSYQPYAFYTESVNLKKGEWTEVSCYMIGQAMNWVDFEVTGIAAGDVFYYDDFTMVEADISMDEFLKKSTVYAGRFDKEAALTRSFLDLDISRTENMLPANSETDVIAYLQSNGTKTENKLGDVVSTAFTDWDNLTVTSEDTGIAKYENNKIVTGSKTGNTVLTFTYNGNSQNMLITVYPDAKNVSVYTDKGVYAEITDPLVSDYKADIPLDDDILDMGIELHKPSVVSFRVYNSGIWNSSKVASTGMGHMLFMYPAYAVNYECNSTAGAEYYIYGNVSGSLVAGWNNIDIVTEYPSNGSYDEGYLNFITYVNGKKVKAQELKAPLTGNVKFNPMQNSSSDKNNIIIISDLKIASMYDEFKIESAKPSENAVLSTLDDIDIKFNHVLGDIPQEAVQVLDSDNNVIETKLFKATVYTLSIKPVGGLKNNSEYTLKIDNSKIVNANGDTLSTGAEYKFTTDSTIVSDVIGAGYKLVNSQYNMTGSADNLTLTQYAELLNEYEVKASVKTQYNNLFTLNADNSFKNDEKADRYIIEYDMKTEATRDEKHKSYHREWVMISAVNSEGNNGIVSNVGCSLGSSVGEYLGFGFYTKNKPADGVVDYTWGTENPYNNYKNKVVSHVLENTGYYHVKLVYDVNENSDNGDVLATIYVTDSDKKEFTYGPVATQVGNGEALFKTLSSIGVQSRETLTDFITKDIYMKNVNIYALKTQAVQADDFEISGVDVTTADDDATQLTSNSQLNEKKIAISYILKNNGMAENQSYAVTAAVYEKGTNKLVAADVESGSVKLGEQTSVLTNELDLTGTSTDKSYELRIFVWDSYKTLKPIISDVILPLN